MEIRWRTTVWASKSFIIIYFGSADPILQLRQVKRETAKIRERIQHFDVQVAKKETLVSN
jgi:hypothetical protein